LILLVRRGENYWCQPITDTVNPVVRSQWEMLV
jgi:hypothetical protein